MCKFQYDASCSTAMDCNKTPKYFLGPFFFLIMVIANATVVGSL